MNVEAYETLIHYSKFFYHMRALCIISAKTQSSFLNSPYKMIQEAKGNKTPW